MAKTKTVKAWVLLDKKGRPIVAEKCPGWYLVSTTKAEAVTVCIMSKGETVRPVTISWTVEEKK